MREGRTMAAHGLDLLAARLRACGVTRVESYAWRDLDDPDAGGSEVHADEILSRWASVGVEVVHRTSRSPAGPESVRHGCRIVRRGGRYGVFPRVIVSRLLRRRRKNTAVVEIWNGVPWFSQLWAGGRGVVWLHHLHDDMWRESLPWPLSGLGRIVETRLAPRWYRRTPIMTLAESTGSALASRGFPAGNIHVVHPGIDSVFRAGAGEKTDHPSVVAVGRLAPVKRFPLLIQQFAGVRRRLPAARLTIVGTGPLDSSLRSLVRSEGLEDCVTLAGRVDEVDLVHLYRTSWLLASASHSEGWGMTITEAAACGTPCVVTDNDGHRIAVDDGVSGVIVADPPDLGEAMVRLLEEPDRLAEMGRGAVAYAGQFSWDTAAEEALRLLVESVEARQRR